MGVISIVNGIYKPTNITGGAPPCSSKWWKWIFPRLIPGYVMGWLPSHRSLVVDQLLGEINVFKSVWDQRRPFCGCKTSTKSPISLTCIYIYMSYTCTIYIETILVYIYIYVYIFVARHISIISPSYPHSCCPHDFPRERTELPDLKLQIPGRLHSVVNQLRRKTSENWQNGTCLEDFSWFIKSILNYNNREYCVAVLPTKTWIRMINWDVL